MSPFGPFIFLRTPQDFYVHGLGLHALEHRQRVPAHAGVNLTDWNGFGTAT